MLYNNCVSQRTCRSFVGQGWRLAVLIDRIDVVLVMREGIGVTSGCSRLNLVNLINHHLVSLGAIPQAPTDT